MVQAPPPPSTTRKIIAILSDISLFHWLWQIAVSLGITLKSQRIVHSATADSVQYWLLTGTVFFGCLALVSGGTRAVSWSLPRFRRWRNPHSVFIEAHGGRANATVQITHAGELAVWSARLRIAEMNDASRNPDAGWNDCYLYKGGRVFRAVDLRDGESADIPLAGIKSSDWHPNWLSVATAGSGIEIPDSGVVLDLELRAQPPTEEGLIVRSYKIRRNGQFVDLLDVSGN